tara:strand:- start:74 stop:367 length:294 start_codon:yes stop_codon:yes gene_type:complete
MAWLKQPQKVHLGTRPKKDHPFKDFKHKRREKQRIPTKEEVKIAVEEYLASGKTIEKLEPLDVKPDSLFFELEKDIDKSFNPEEEFQQNFQIIDNES